MMTVYAQTRKHLIQTAKIGDVLKKVKEMNKRDLEEGREFIMDAITADPPINGDIKYIGFYTKE